MKKITLSLFAAAFSCASGFSQVLVQEFTAPFNPAAAGWIVQNNSVPAGPLSWAQGNSTGNNFGSAAYSGTYNDFFQADYMATGNVGDISAWLITPVVSIYNGANLQFAVRTLSFTAPAIYADRLQVRMSQQVSATIANNATAVAPFNDLLLDINPNLTTTYATAVTNSVVNGFPASWTVYNIPISGITGTVTGRFAFRYFVTNGGASGANSRFVGIDAFKYTTPCEPSIQSFTSCPGVNGSLIATGAPLTTYSWSTGGTTSSIPVNPGSTTVYTLFPGNNGVACGNAITATVTVGSQLNVNVVATATQVCEGNQILFTASSPAASGFTWSVGNVTTNTLLVNANAPGAATIGVLASNGLCFGGSILNLNILPAPSLSLAMSPACAGGTFDITFSGAATYTFLDQFNPSVSVPSPTMIGGNGYNFDVFATGANGCVSGANVTFTVFPNPTITAVPSKSVACINQTITMTGNGASTYTWNYNTNQTTTTTAFTYSTGTTAGNKSFTLTGVDANGCSARVVRTVSVSLCTGVQDIDGNMIETSVFPNPFTNELRIGGLDGKVQIFNALGQAVLTVSVNDKETINTSDFSKGVYILKAFDLSGREVRTVKLVKN